MMRLCFLCGLFLLAVGVCRAYTVPLFNGYDFYETPLWVTNGRVMQSERTLDENGNPIKLQYEKKSTPPSKCHKKIKPETTTENCDEDDEPTKQPTTTMKSSKQTTTENCDEAEEPKKMATTTPKSSKQQTTTENCDEEEESKPSSVAKTTTTKTTSTTENCDEETPAAKTKPATTTAATATTTCEEDNVIDEPTTESYVGDESFQASTTEVSNADAPIILDYKESYDRIIHDLRGHWISPIDYLIQRGYLPKNAANEIDRVKEKLLKEQERNDETTATYDAKNSDLYSNSIKTGAFSHQASAYEKMKAELAAKQRLDGVSHEVHETFSDPHISHIVNNVTNEVLAQKEVKVEKEKDTEKDDDDTFMTPKTSELEDFERTYNILPKSQKARALNFKYANRHGSTYQRKKLRKEMEKAVRKFYDRQFNKVLDSNHDKMATKHDKKHKPRLVAPGRAGVVNIGRVGGIPAGAGAPMPADDYSQHYDEQADYAQNVNYQDYGQDNAKTAGDPEVPPDWDIHKAIEILKNMRR